MRSMAQHASGPVALTSEQEFLLGLGCIQRVTLGHRSHEKTERGTRSQMILDFLRLKIDNVSEGQSLILEGTESQGIL